MLTSEGKCAQVGGTARSCPLHRRSRRALERRLPVLRAVERGEGLGEPMRLSHHPFSFHLVARTSPLSPFESLI